MRSSPDDVIGLPNYLPTCLHYCLRTLLEHSLCVNMHFWGLALTALEGGLKGVGRILSAGYIQNVANVANPSFKVSFVSEVFFYKKKC